MTTDSAPERPRAEVEESPNREETPRRGLAWPVDGQLYLTLDFECDYGTALKNNTYEAVTHVDKLVGLLERLEVPLTVFVQTALFDERPETVEALRECGVDVRFHPHSHTHRGRDHTDETRDHDRTRQEIETSADYYREFFGREPVGYRFPDGNILRRDYQLLVDEGFEFDASIFPSWRPGRFNNSAASTTPEYLPEMDLVEIPFTIFDDRFRVPTALSYCRLFGRPYTDMLLARPPGAVVFNIHMHDLVNPPSYEDLSRFYKAVYARNADGFGWLERVLRAFDARGYSFATIDHVHDLLRDRLAAER